MLRKAAIFLLGFVLVGSTGGALADVWLERAVIKLIERYYELSQKVQDLSQRVEMLERQMEAQRRDGGVREFGVKEKYYTLERLRVRSCPRTNCKVVAILEKGEVLSLLSRKGEWSFIETLDGVRGWVVSKHLREYSY
ncbi:SH3 domain-containing protein [Thermocrinis sp.]|jgi:uncharacterized protein YgiM (DUF1202 family)|uniref:SH3 domain-containing protein n=1 Tax=Thermocrinis sp. TaxID=2024383 RepID=UPI003BFFE18A